MENDGKCSRNENSNSKGVAETSSPSGLRRSVREVPSNKNVNVNVNVSPNTSSTRKSERLERRTPTPIVQRKVEKQSTQSPLRRSERGKKQSSSSSSGSKRSNNKSSGLSFNKKLKKEKSVKNLTFETKDVSISEKQAEEKILDARGYRASFKPKQRKDNATGGGRVLNVENKTSQECSSSAKASASKDVDEVNEYDRGNSEELREIHSERTLEESNCSIREPANEVDESNTGLQSSPSQNHILAEEDNQSEDGGIGGDAKGVDVVMLSSHKSMSKNQDKTDDMTKDILQSGLVNPVLNRAGLDSGVGLESGVKDILSRAKRNAVDKDSDSSAMASSKNMHTSLDDAIISSVHGNNFVESCGTSFKRQRVDHKLCNTILNHNTRSASLTRDRGEIGGGINTGLAEPCNTSSQRKKCSVDFQKDGNQNVCIICKGGGRLLCCEGKGCRRSFHLECVGPPFKDVPLGVWYCLACVTKKIKSGVHSVSEGVESIWDVKEVEVPDNNGLQKKQYLVKYKGLAHVHNRWVPETQLLVEAPLLVAKFNRKNQAVKWKAEWTEPRRLLQKRLLVSPKRHEKVQEGYADNVLGCRYEWLVKWHGLDYRHTTWELENAAFLELPKVQSLMKDYENRHQKAERGHFVPGIDKELDIKKGSSIESSELLAGVLTGVSNNHLEIIYNFLEYWKKGQNVVVIDDQERIMKVIKFISSLSSYVSWPFLVVTTSAALSFWDEELFRHTPSVDAVFYHGDKDLRRSIKAVEFHRGNDIMCEVLITTPEVIAEDLDVLGSQKWEVIIVDECQKFKRTYLEQIKGLNTNMRLLLYNGQLKDGCIENLLSLVDCQTVLDGSDSLLTKSSDKIAKLKERLSKYVLTSSKSDNLRFVEYWVPVQLSNMQLEQYCSILLSNSLLICSSSKNDLVGALSDVLISTRKCCDHPYIMDSPKEGTSAKDAKEILDIGIKASGKLLLLEAVLFEIKNKGFRVIILFQSSGPGKDKIGDILDDFVRQRFGLDSYERIDGFVNPKRKQAALNNFNNQKRRFVFLLETCACLPSIKLSSVDTVIIFGSDWSPANDLRNLRKLTIDSQFDQLKIFRLYSSFTVEENVLILAKQHKTFDNIQSISRATSQSLLMQGASYLFSKLDEFHSSCASITGGSFSFDRFSVKDVIQDFVTILSRNAIDSNAGCSIILKAQQDQGAYVSDSLLPGELKIQSSDEELPHMFWKKLLEGKQPEWKFSSGLSQRNRKRVQPSEDFLKKPEGDGEEVVKKRKKMTNNDVDLNSSKPALFEANTAAGDDEGPSHNVRQLMSSSVRRVEASYANHALDPPSLTDIISKEPADNMAESNERINLLDSQKSLHLLLTPEIAKLCDILNLPENVKATVQSFLEYVMNNHCVSREPATILQAFQISLCWTAASLLKHKLDNKESLVLAKRHLNFGCTKEEADGVYSLLRCLKKVFVYHTQDFRLTCSPEISQSSTKFVDKEHIEASSDQSLLQLGVAQQDYSKSIKDIEKKCDKKMRKLLQKQKEELADFSKKYNEEKAQLENKQKTEAAVVRFHSSSSMRTDKLKLLDVEYKKRFEELEQRKEMHCKDLEEMHVAAREKLEKRRASWLEKLKSWAKEEIISRMPSKETGYNQENAASLNSNLQEQNRGGTQSTQDREVPLEIPEVVSSNDDDDLLPGVPSTNEQIPGGIKANILDGKTPPKVSTVISLRDEPEVNVSSSEEQFSDTEDRLGVRKVVSFSGGPENKFSSNEHGCLDKTTLMLPPKLSMGTPEVADSTGSQVNIQGLENSPLEVVGNGNTITRLKDSIDTRPSENSTEVDQQDVVCTVDQEPSGEKQDRIFSSGLTENASNIIGDNIGEKQDGRVMMDKNISYGSSDKIARHAGAKFGVLESALSRVVERTENSKHQDGMIQAVETLCDQDSQPLDKIAELNQPGVINEDLHPYEQSLALQDGVASVIGNHSTSQQIDASVHNQNDIVASCQENRGVPVAEHVVQMPEPSSSVDSGDLPSVGETERQPNHEGCINNNVAGTSVPMVEDQVDCLNQAVSQPAPHITEHLQSENPTGSGAHVSDARTLPISLGVDNHTVQATPPVQVSPPLVYHDPLQIELERMRKETEQFVNAHEDTKSQLKADCEKEIEEVVAQIRRKYGIKLQEQESEFLVKKKERDTNEKKVLMNKILAEAFRSKCMDIKPSGAPSMQQEGSLTFMQQLLQLSSQNAQPTAQRNADVAGLSSVGPPADGPQIAVPSSRSIAPSLHTVHNSPSLISGNVTRPPHISSISPATGNLQIGSQIRSPPPHLQRFRSSSSTIPTNLSPVAVGMPGQQMPSNPATTSAIPSQPPIQPQPSAQQSQLHNSAHKPETSRVLPPLGSTTLSALELLMDVSKQGNANAPSSLQPLSNLGSSSDPLVVRTNTRTNVVCPSEVVCLSDDD